MAKAHPPNRLNGEMTAESGLARALRLQNRRVGPAVFDADLRRQDGYSLYLSLKVAW
jgi:hypothetical protein